MIDTVDQKVVSSSKYLNGVAYTLLFIGLSGRYYLYETGATLGYIIIELAFASYFFVSMITMVHTFYCKHSMNKINVRVSYAHIIFLILVIFLW